MSADRTMYGLVAFAASLVIVDLSVLIFVLIHTLLVDGWFSASKVLIVIVFAAALPFLTLGAVGIARAQPEP